MPIYASLSENRSYSHNTLFPFSLVILYSSCSKRHIHAPHRAARQRGKPRRKDRMSHWRGRHVQQKHAVMTNYMHHSYPSQEPLYKGSMRLPFPSRNMLWNPETNKNCWCSMLTGDLQQWFSPLTERGHKRATEVSRESANLKHCRWGTINLPCVCGERHHLPDLVYVTCRLMICSCFNWYILYWFAQGNMYSHTACWRHSYWSRTMTNGMNASDCRQSL